MKKINSKKVILKYILSIFYLLFCCELQITSFIDNNNKFIEKDQDDLQYFFDINSPLNNLQSQLIQRNILQQSLINENIWEEIGELPNLNNQLQQKINFYENAPNFANQNQEFQLINDKNKKELDNQVQEFQPINDKNQEIEEFLLDNNDNVKKSKELLEQPIQQKKIIEEGIISKRVPIKQSKDDKKKFYENPNEQISDDEENVIKNQDIIQQLTTEEVQHNIEINNFFLQYYNVQTREKNKLIISSQNKKLFFKLYKTSYKDLTKLLISVLDIIPINEESLFNYFSLFKKLYNKEKIDLTLNGKRNVDYTILQSYSVFKDNDIYMFLNGLFCKNNQENQLKNNTDVNMSDTELINFVNELKDNGIAYKYINEKLLIKQINCSNIIIYYYTDINGTEHKIKENKQNNFNFYNFYKVLFYLNNSLSIDHKNMNILYGIKELTKNTNIKKIILMLQNLNNCNNELKRINKTKFDQKKKLFLDQLQSTEGLKFNDEMIIYYKNEFIFKYKNKTNIFELTMHHDKMFNILYYLKNNIYISEIHQKDEYNFLYMALSRILTRIKYSQNEDAEKAKNLFMIVKYLKNTNKKLSKINPNNFHSKKNLIYEQLISKTGLILNDQINVYYKNEFVFEYKNKTNLLNIKFDHSIMFNILYCLKNNIYISEIDQNEEYELLYNNLKIMLNNRKEKFNYWVNRLEIIDDLFKIVNCLININKKFNIINPHQLCEKKILIYNQLISTNGIDFSDKLQNNTLIIFYEVTNNQFIFQYNQKIIVLEGKFSRFIMFNIIFFLKNNIYISQNNQKTEYELLYNNLKKNLNDEKNKTNIDKNVLNILNDLLLIIKDLILINEQNIKNININNVSLEDEISNNVPSNYQNNELEFIDTSSKRIKNNNNVEKIIPVNLKFNENNNKKRIEKQNNKNELNIFKIPSITFHTIVDQINTAHDINTKIKESMLFLIDFLKNKKTKFVLLNETTNTSIKIIYKKQSNKLKIYYYKSEISLIQSNHFSKKLAYTVVFLNYYIIKILTKIHLGIFIEENSDDYGILLQINKNNSLIGGFLLQLNQLNIKQYYIILPQQQFNKIFSLKDSNILNFFK